MRKTWTIHLIALSVIVIWAMIDLRFESMVASPGDVGGFRIASFGIVLSVATATLLMLLAGFFRSCGDSRSRSIQSMLGLTAIIAGWCAIADNHESIAWQGKRARLAMQVDELKCLTESLRRDWPQQDGDLPGIGPFMAYPFGRPTTLVLLQSPPISGEDLCIAAIERRPEGAILLKLSGTSHDDWAEWHPDGSTPKSFVGGLADPHQIHTAVALGSGWFLVRYNIKSNADVAFDRSPRVPNLSDASGEASVRTDGKTIGKAATLINVDTENKVILGQDSLT